MLPGRRAEALTPERSRRNVAKLLAREAGEQSGRVTVNYGNLRNHVREASVYASIRQGKAKPGMTEELTRRIKEGAIPIISDVEGFRAYYVVYASDDTVTAISIFNDYAGAEESNRRALAWIEQNLTPLLAGPAIAMAGPVIVHTLA